MKSILQFSGRNPRTGIAASAILGLFLLMASGPSWAGCSVTINTAGPLDFNEVPVFQTSDSMPVEVQTSCGSPPDVAMNGNHPGDFEVVGGPARGGTSTYFYDVEFTPQNSGLRQANLEFSVIGGETNSIGLEGIGVGGCDSATVTPMNHDFGNVAIGDSESVGITLDLGDASNGRGKGEPQPCQLWNVFFDNCSVRGISTQGTCEPFSYSATGFPTMWDATFEPTEAGPANDTLRFVLRSDSARGISGEFVELTVKLSGNGGDPDSDGDGVLDDFDLCDGTMIPESVPTTGKLGRNRWALTDDEGMGDTSFDTNAPRGGGPDRSFTTEQTGGCSCEQILGEFGVNPNSGQYKFGCSGSTMLGWISLVPTQCISSGEFCGGIAGIPCSEGLFCADDPADPCGAGGADCPGLCVYGTPEQCPTWTPLP